jgi:hypothetical protein
MSVLYFEPLGRSWERARRMLFRPFRLELWLVLGFAAFLSNLTDGGGGGSWGGRFGRADLGELGGTLHDFLHTPWFVWSLGLGIAFLLVLGVVFTWISARGRFIFLDNVLHERAAIVEPWKRFARLGNSLFGLQLILGLGMLAFLLVLFGPVLFSILRAIWEDGSVPDVHWFDFAIRGLIAFPVGLFVAAFYSLTRHFVVPLMWKYDLRAGAGWSRFWSLCAQRPGAFIVYLLLLVLLYIGLAVAVLVFGFCTCCMGFVLLALPYVGSVALLPIHVTLRGFGPEFLAQFGPEWDVRP